MRFKTGILAVLLSLPILLCPFSRAFAVTATSGNFEFIESAANEAGLETGDLIATMVANMTAVTGAGFVRGGLNGSAIALGNTAADNLNALIDSADFPEYSTLTQEQQQSWGSAENYNSAKFNSLMTAFGLGGSYDSFISSGGGNFEWGEDAKDRLDQIGRIGRNWISGAGNTISSLFDAITNKQPIYNYIGRQDYALINGADYSNWPTNAPATLYVSKGTVSKFIWQYGTNKIVSDLYTSNEVYYIPCVYGGTIARIVFDKVRFTAGVTNTANYIPEFNLTPTENTYNGQYYYWLSNSQSPYNVNATAVSQNMQVNSVTRQQFNALSSVVPLILFGDGLDNIGEYDQISDYPEDIQPDSDEEVYFPQGGITPIVNWGDFITKAPEPGTVDLSEIVALLKQFKFYVSGHLKVHDEGVFDSITDLGTLLTGIDSTLKQVLAKIGLGSDTSEVIGDFDFPEFDEKATDLVDTVSDLAPFGSLLLISAVVDMAAATGSIQDPSLVVPFQFMPGEEYSVTLDFSWLDPLKPVINALLIMVLIMTLAGVTLRFVELEAAS